MVLGLLGGQNSVGAFISIACFIWYMVLACIIYVRFLHVMSKNRESIWFMKFKLLPYLFFIRKDPELPSSLIIHLYIAFAAFALTVILL